MDGGHQYDIEVSPGEYGPVSKISQGEVQGIQGTAYIVSDTRDRAKFGE
jgi:hypothetical protein